MQACNDRASLCAALAAFAPVVAQLEQAALDCGVEKTVLDQCLRSMQEQARQLDELAKNQPDDQSGPSEPAPPDNPHG